MNLRERRLEKWMVLYTLYSLSILSFPNDLLVTVRFYLHQPREPSPKEFLYLSLFLTVLIIS